MQSHVENKSRMLPQGEGHRPDIPQKHAISSISSFMINGKILFLSIRTNLECIGGNDVDIIHLTYIFITMYYSYTRARTHR